MVKYIAKIAHGSDVYYVKDSEAREVLIDKSEKGVANGVATLDSTGKVPSTQLPPSHTDTTYTFTGGTNKFTVTPSDGTPQDVTVTPSIDDNVTASGNFAANAIIVGNDANKVAKNSGVTISTTAPSSSSDDTTVPTSKAVLTAIDNLPEPMIFKGSLGTGGTITTLPTAASANIGWTYKVITAGTYDSQAAKVGDLFISDGSSWVYIPSADEPSGTVTNIATGTGLTGGPITSTGTISLAESGATAGTYNNVTVDSYGRVTSGSNEDYYIKYTHTISKNKGVRITFTGTYNAIVTCRATGGTTSYLTLTGTGYSSTAGSGRNKWVKILGGSAYTWTDSSTTAKSVEILSNNSDYDTTVTVLCIMGTVSSFTEITELSGDARTDVVARTGINVSNFTNDAGYLTSHQDISGKKDVQTAVSDPSASGTSLTFIKTISLNTLGVITPTKATVSTMGASGSNAAAGLVPKPSTTAGTTKFLREDATWVVPTNTNTHRPIQVNGTQILGDNTTALNLKAGSNVSLSNSSGTVTIAATDTTYSSLSAENGGTDVSLVTTGEKYSWNQRAPKITFADYTTNDVNYTIFASVSATSTSRYKDCIVLVAGGGYYYGGGYTGAWLIEMRSSSDGDTVTDGVSTGPSMTVRRLSALSSTSTVTFGYYTDTTAGKTYFGIKSTKRRGEFNVTTLMNNSNLFTISTSVLEQNPVATEPSAWTEASSSYIMSANAATLTANLVLIGDGSNLIKASGYTIGTSVPSDAVFTDTKNTAGSTNTSSKIYLIGATSQAANPQTYSHDTAFVDANGRLNSAAPASSANDTTVATTKWVKDQGYITSYTDTKNTAGSTDKDLVKLYLIGATTQATSALTYSNSDYYIGDDNVFYGNRIQGSTLVYSPIVRATNLLACSTDMSTLSGVVQWSMNSQSLYISCGSGSLLCSKAWTTSSDIRKKNIISNIDVTLNDIANAPLFNYKLKDIEDDDILVGTSALYWQDVLPNAVKESSNGYLSLDYGGVALTSAITTARVVKEQEQRITELEEQIENLKQIINNLGINNNNNV